jgi:hypothetical protein
MEEKTGLRIISDPHFPTYLTRKEIAAGFKIEAIIIGFATAAERMVEKRPYTKVAVKDIRPNAKLVKVDSFVRGDKGYSLLAYGLSRIDTNKIVEVGWSGNWFVSSRSIEAALLRFETTPLEFSFRCLLDDPPEITVISDISTPRQHR